MKINSHDLIFWTQALLVNVVFIGIAVYLEKYSVLSWPVWYSLGVVNTLLLVAKAGIFHNG